ncbi:hypothetical protein VTN77DRAFT_4589 [Rasamsonia byssochlamydoides]|uniref:uncharacterized protein n=1 Tax=Rasamsonia byssochlamydoides TaxID=89139 RepID=UPI00374389EC
MPPIRAKNSRKSIEQEGRIELAISAYKNGEFPSIRQAASVYNVPNATLAHRIKGRAARVSLRANSHKLTANEEETLVKWILDLNKRGLPPRPAFVENMANHLLSQRGSQGPPPRVGKNWVFKLVKRHDELQTRYTRRYNHERAKCEESSIIGGWFDCLYEKIMKYGIQPDDIYNFDETGFAMGLIATTKVITSSEVYSRPKLLQPGNREWVTAIESVSATGWALPTYIIFKAKELQDSWFDDLPKGWRLDKSENGWTTDEIGIKWLKNQFIPETYKRRKGAHRLLVLDGHGSHLTPQFDEICAENNIIPVCMPAHSSHLLQPLDVSIFVVLKQGYGHLVEQRMRHGFNHINKLDFLEAYPTARMEAFKTQNIQNGFAATGIHPFDPDQVIQRLHIQLKTPTPPGSRSSNSQSSWVLQTPHNPRQLQRQATAVKKPIENGQISPSSPFDQAFDQITKACEATMVQAAIMKKQYQDIFAAHEKEKQKRQRSKKKIRHEGGITRDEAQELIRSRDQPVEPPVNDPQQSQLPTSPPRVCMQFRCSDCNVLGHRSPQCPNRNKS